MRFVLLFPFVLFACIAIQAQTVTVPVDFENGSVVTSDFTNFSGGTGSVVSNPLVNPTNPSSTVGRIVRNGGQVWAGAYLTTNPYLDLVSDPIICMKVYTTAPAGTRVAMKLEGPGGNPWVEIDAFTSVTGDWETLCWDFTGQPNNYNRLVFLFALGSTGNGSASSTFFFDDVELRSTLPLSLTPGSQLYCPSIALTLTFPGSGNYSWFADPAGTTLLQAGSSSFTTGILSTDTSFFVRDMTPINYSATAFGPGIVGNSYIGNSFTTSTFFTSNLDNGFFHSVDIVPHIPTGPPPMNTCTYQVEVFNLTQGTSRSLTQSFLNPVNNSPRQFAFASPLPVSLNDQLEMRVNSITGHPCYCTSTGAGNSGSYIPFPNSFDPQITFTGHTSANVANQLMSGLRYTMSGDFIDPTLFQVNAIVDCSSTLPVDLIDFSVQDVKGDAHLFWITASEKDNDRFDVMRSQNGIDFEFVGSVSGAGNTTTSTDYSFVDRSPLPGVSYYRLTQVDLDGTETFSWLVSYHHKTLLSIKAFPNPSSGWLNVHLGKESDNVNVEIIDVYGRTLHNYQYDSAQQMRVELGEAPGNYFVVVTIGGTQRAVFNAIHSGR